MEKEHDEKSIYEISYHLLPSLSEEDSLKKYLDIKTFLEKCGCSFISDDAPKQRPLAYTITKKIDGKNQKFNSGYFGWIKFETKKASLVEIKKTFDADVTILRYLLIKTVRENTLIGKAIKKVETTDKKKDDVSAVSSEDIDKKIEELVETK